MREKTKALTLVEVLVAAGVIVVAAAAILYFFTSSLALSETNKERTIAMNHLGAIMESIASTPYSNIAVDFPNGMIDGPPGNSYSTIANGYTLEDEHITVTHVNPNGDPLEIYAALSWTDRRGITRTDYLATKKTR